MILHSQHPVQAMSCSIGPSPILKQAMAMLPTRASFEDPSAGSMKRCRKRNEHDMTASKKTKSEQGAPENDVSEMQVFELPPARYV